MGNFSNCIGNIVRCNFRRYLPDGNRSVDLTLTSARTQAPPSLIAVTQRVLSDMSWGWNRGRDYLPPYCPSYQDIDELAIENLSRRPLRRR